MAKISHEDFLRMQQEKQNRQQADNSQAFDGTRVGYFSLKNDNDSAIVRLNVDSVNDLEIYTVHSVKVEGKFKKINCLRTFKDPIDACPLCAAKKSYQQKIFIKLLEYVTVPDEHGVETIQVQPKIWERPVSFLQTLVDYEKEYGSLSDCILKVVRHGAAGSMDTKYNFIYPNQKIYNQETYPVDFSAFNNYEVIGGPVVDMTYDEISKIVDKIEPDQFSNKSASQKVGFTASVTPVAPTSYTTTGTSVETTSYTTSTGVPLPFTEDLPFAEQAPNPVPHGGQRRVTY